MFTSLLELVKQIPDLETIDFEVDSPEALCYLILAKRELEEKAALLSSLADRTDAICAEFCRKLFAEE